MELSEFIDLLCCPDCKGKLTEISEKGILHCEDCSLDFPVKGGIPFLVNPDKSDEISEYLSSFGLEFGTIPDGGEKRGLKDFFIFPNPKFNTSSVRNFRQIREILSEFESDGSQFLNVGSRGGISEKFLGQELRERFVGVDIYPYDGVDVVGDAMNLPISSDSISFVLISSVLQYLSQPWRAVSEIYRVLKNGGYVYVEVPFMQGFHEVNTDYFRFTLPGLEKLFSDFRNIKSGVNGGPASTVSWVFPEFAAAFFNNRKIHQVIKLILSWIMFPVKFFDLFLAKRRYSSKIACGFFFLGRKV